VKMVSHSAVQEQVLENKHGQYVVTGGDAKHWNSAQKTSCKKQI